ncbi:conserved hypothetical protein [Nitrobacter hamburgensis X14]|uniref:DUF5666 domain-containing protein n=1 Tax=Nitrobacter hamburgensis (strain DSM 10229 / NCIMB 13809 / X14) TaxID=323097 RepID=Q1QR92_NITHX|nr:hypothetical protein [Nitrobacter hamburgensis]ABE61255.1 conserved hypothetical protein [Nitrobacter hamburgensis X14]
MRLAKIILAGSALTIVSAMASAQTTPAIKETPPPPGTQKGLVTVVNRLDNTIAIRAEQDNKDGAKAPDKTKPDEAKPDDAKSDGAKAEGATTQFKIDHKLSETVHAGDKVKFSVSEGGDPKTNTEKTITKIEAE